MASRSGSTSFAVTGIFTELPITTRSVSGFATGGRFGDPSSILRISTLPISVVAQVSVVDRVPHDRQWASCRSQCDVQLLTSQFASTPVGKSSTAMLRSSPSGSTSLAKTGTSRPTPTGRRTASGKASGALDAAVTSTVTVVVWLVLPCGSAA